MFELASIPSFCCFLCCKGMLFKVCRISCSVVISLLSFKYIYGRPYPPLAPEGPVLYNKIMAWSWLALVGTDRYTTTRSERCMLCCIILFQAVVVKIYPIRKKFINHKIVNLLKVNFKGFINYLKYWR